MKADNASPPSLPATAAGFQTTVSVVNVSNATWVKLLEADPQRWHVWIYSSGGASIPSIGPDGIQTSAVPAVTNLPFSFTFQDAPSLVTGAWYGRSSGVATPVVIVNTRYLGG
jgi:hypothetical protein